MIDARNRNSAQASVLCEELARCGVRDAVLSPGSRSSPVALALDAEPGITVHVVLDERSAGFVALGLGLASQRPVAVACTSGSAAANLHPAVVESDLAGVPLIVLTSDRPPELRDIGAGQTIDQIKLYGSAVRWFCEAGSHEADDAGLLHYRSIGCRAVAEAARGRGPVHLNLSWRDPLGPEEVAGDVTATDPLALAGRDSGRPLTAGLVGREASTGLIEALIEALSRAERPLIVAGRDPRAEDAIAGFASRAGIPVLAEPTSGQRLRHGYERAIGAYDLILRDPPAALTPDLVLRSGDMPTSKPLRAWLAAADGPDQIVIGAPGRWNDPTRKAGAIVDADPSATLAELAVALPDDAAESRSDWLGLWQTAEAAAQQAIDSVLSGAPAMNEPALARALGAAVTHGESILLASSMPIRDAESFMAPRAADVRTYSNRGANGIDGLISTGAGLALGSGGPVWALLGDLATAYDVGALGLAAALPAHAPLRLLVADNGGGHIFDFLPQAGQVEADRFERLFTTPATPDFEGLAGVFGLAYEELTDPADLRAIGERHTGSILIHARLDPAGNVELHREIAAEVSRRAKAAAPRA